MSRAELGEDEPELSLGLREQNSGGGLAGDGAQGGWRMPWEYFFGSVSTGEN